jgi:two-component system osmolarity sensor histidine kinase EnvZ
MTFGWLKRSMPRGLYGRAALILILPVLALQVAVSIVFIQRHFEDVTRQMTRGVVLELQLLLDAEGGGGLPAAEPLARGLRIGLGPPPDGEGVPRGDARVVYDLSGRVVIATLRDSLPEVRAVDLRGAPGEVLVWLDATGGPLLAEISRRRVSASNPHQFLVLMAAVGAVMTAVAFVYLRNQLRPITRLAAAAEAFGKGRRMDYAPSGAVEVRAAGRAFLDMRDRIERQIEQRTLLLSGVSHDLRTPLTRLKLELSMMPPGPEAEAMQQDLAEMEGLIDGFLDFARGSSTEPPAPAAPADIARRAVEKAQRAGGRVTLCAPVQDAALPLPLRAEAVERALGNLIGNAMRYAGRAEVSVALAPGELRFTVEDDGPGIPPGRRQEATEPFTRLDAARNQDRGSGVGLGLSIARDIARSHGGDITLDDSPLGGLRAIIRIPA